MPLGPGEASPCEVDRGGGVDREGYDISGDQRGDDEGDGNCEAECHVRLLHGAGAHDSLSRRRAVKMPAIR